MAQSEAAVARKLAAIVNDKISAQLKERDDTIESMRKAMSEMMGEMNALSSFLNARMHELLTTRHLGWFKFFKALDTDGVGRRGKRRPALAASPPLPSFSYSKTAWCCC